MGERTTFEVWEEVVEQAAIPSASKPAGQEMGMMKAAKQPPKIPFISFSCPVPQYP